ncbi:MAG: hypothetical protein EAZ85_11770 [Bacteroidetes bacterium]|nr:MAG: hypothetical protein EAZ85_11770 [Bacteroidota bacterium]TAG86694.1 MAG: hypothetical protein EAZ20_12260 [Bacteroidota bacterium]
MQINSTITGVQYQVFLAKELEIINTEDFDINTCPTSCIYVDKKINFAISKWVSPKRTRSYPYERVYNTLTNGKKISVIPVVKDEGFDGDRDFIQWDTVSMMSLLDIYVILAYYEKAEKNKNYNNKITNQKFDNQYVLDKIKQISAYHSSALHWNLQELNDNFSDIITKVKSSYVKISKQTKVQMHNEKGIDDFATMISKSTEEFMEFSRQKAKDAQSREFVTLQPKEVLETLTKAKITIKNYLGGQYFLTVDEIRIDKKDVYLIEGKHSKSSLLPSKSDIKDGLLKMILYTNLKNTEINGKPKNAVAVLLLTSSKLKSNVDSNANKTEFENFCIKNKLNNAQQNFVMTLFEEANTNGFFVTLKKG